MNNGINTTKKRICTIILPVYNSQRYLNRTISSVLQQTLEDFELLAIDDGSADGSVALLQRWAQKDSRVHVICNPVNQGVAAVRNQGIALAQGQYIAFLDSDDTWHSNKLEQQVALLEQTNCDFCCTAYAMITEDGRRMKNRMIAQQQILLPDLLKENYICCSSVLLRSAVAKQYLMDGSYAHEDYVYWLTLLQAGAKGCVLNKCLTGYRLAQTSRSANKLKAAQGRWQVYRRYLGYGVCKSGWYFVQYAVNGWKKYGRGVNGQHRKRDVKTAKE